MLDLYNSTITTYGAPDYYPRHWGQLANSTTTREERNPLCGDCLTMYLVVVDGVVQEVSFHSDQVCCAFCKASTALLTEQLVGCSTEEVSTMNDTTVFALIGTTSDKVRSIAPARLMCALLGLKALLVGLFGAAKWRDEWAR